MNNPFTKHPHSVGETYFEHMLEAMKYMFKLQLLSIIMVRRLLDLKVVLC